MIQYINWKDPSTKDGEIGKVSLRLSTPRGSVEIDYKPKSAKPITKRLYNTFYKADKMESSPKICCAKNIFFNNPDL
jgi:hypothetical protein